MSVVCVDLVKLESELFFLSQLVGSEVTETAAGNVMRAVKRVAEQGKTASTSSASKQAEVIQISKARRMKDELEGLNLTNERDVTIPSLDRKALADQRSQLTSIVRKMCAKKFPGFRPSTKIDRENKLLNVILVPEETDTTSRTRPLRKKRRA